MIQEIHKKKLIGCQLLDYFGKYQTGNPIIAQVINRYVLIFPSVTIHSFIYSLTV